VLPLGVLVIVFLAGGVIVFLAGGVVVFFTGGVVVCGLPSVFLTGVFLGAEAFLGAGVLGPPTI